jgi:hypothetical protein
VNVQVVVVPFVLSVLSFYRCCDHTCTNSFLVWFGLVWFGLVWFGLVWFGLVWLGLARYTPGIVQDHVTPLDTSFPSLHVYERESQRDQKYWMEQQTGKQPNKQPPTRPRPVAASVSVSVSINSSSSYSNKASASRQRAAATKGKARTKRKGKLQR